MAHEDRVDNGQPTKAADAVDDAAGEMVSAGAEHATEDTVLQQAGSAADTDELDGGTDATDGTPVPSPVAGSESAPAHRDAEAGQKPLTSPVVNMAAGIRHAQAMVDMANSPAMRMARQAARAAQNLSRFTLPRIQPPVLKVLSDPSFLKSLETFTKSLTVPQVQLPSSLYDSTQWRQLIRSLSTTQHLLLARQLAPLQDAMLQHTQFVAGIIESTANFRELASSFSRSFHFNWAQLFPNLKQLRKSVRTSLLAGFLRADLWPAPSMPIELLDKIGQLAYGGDLRPVLLTVWNHYARKNHAALEQAIAAWWDDPEFAARRDIFEAALTGHRQKLYALTIPTLLAQVEGIAGDFVHGSASAGPAPKLGKSSQIVRHAIEVAGKAGITDLDNAELLHVVLVEAVIEHVQHVSFESADFAAQYAEIRTRRKLNRHGTLHGIQINYPSAMNSLRCFLLLDALYALRKHARQAAATSAASATP